MVAGKSLRRPDAVTAADERASACRRCGTDPDDPICYQGAMDRYPTILPDVRLTIAAQSRLRALIGT